MAAEIVRFVSAYHKMPLSERGLPETKKQVEVIKKLIEENLPTALFFAVGYAITLGEACDDTAWIQSLVQKASAIAANFDREDQEDLQPIFQKYLG